MGQFACIQFNQDNILISKKEIAAITQISYLGHIGYQVQLSLDAKEMTQKQWKKLEQQLDRYNIEYLNTKEHIEYTFENAIVVGGDELKPYFAKLIIDYINRYNLVQTSHLFVKVGIIGGDIRQMMAIISCLMEHVSELTIFSETPYMYKELLVEIYKESRLKVRCVIPSRKTLENLHLVYDCMGRRNYAKWCNPKSIYIDLNHYFAKRTLLFHDYPPIIWYNFDIVCEGQLIPVELLQSILLSQGISRRLIPLTLKKMNIKIARPYTIGIS